LIAHGGEDAQQLPCIEDRRSASAEINGVGGFVERSSERTSQLRRNLARVSDIFDQAGNVIFVGGLREYVGGEVAVAALGPAEGDGDVEAEGHVVVYFMGCALPCGGLEWSDGTRHRRAPQIIRSTVTRTN